MITHVEIELFHACLTKNDVIVLPLVNFNVTMRIKLNVQLIERQGNLQHVILISVLVEKIPVAVLNSMVWFLQ